MAEVPLSPNSDGPAGLPGNGAEDRIRFFRSSAFAANPYRIVILSVFTFFHKKTAEPGGSAVLDGRESKNRHPFPCPQSTRVRSLTFVPVGPVTTSPPTASSAV